MYGIFSKGFVMSSQNKVVILDDDESLLEVLKLFLDEEFETHAFKDPKIAMEFLKVNSVHCLVLDYHMGEKGGSPLIKMISEAQPDLSILILSGDVSVADEVRSLRNEKISFQAKPVTMNRLTSILQNMTSFSNQLGVNLSFNDSQNVRFLMGS